MSSMRSDHHDDRDIMSQQAVSLIADYVFRRDQWRCIFLILRAHRILISGADRAKKASTDSKGDADLEHAEIVEFLPSSPQVLFEVQCDGLNDSTDVSGVKLQPENIAQIVEAKDLGSLQKFDGIQAIAEAHDTDLEKGIPGDKGDLCSQRVMINTVLSDAEAPARGFFKSFLKSCNSYIIFLLIMSAAMSIGFGINEKGLRTGWCEGLIIILAIIIRLVVSSRL